MKTDEKMKNQKVISYIFMLVYVYLYTFYKNVDQQTMANGAIEEVVYLRDWSS